MRALAAPSAVAVVGHRRNRRIHHADDLFQVREVVVAVGQGGDVESIGIAGDRVFTPPLVVVLVVSRMPDWSSASNSLEPSTSIEMVPMSIAPSVRENDDTMVLAAL